MKRAAPDCHDTTSNKRLKLESGNWVRKITQVKPFRFATDVLSEKRKLQKSDKKPEAQPAPPCEPLVSLKRRLSYSGVCPPAISRPSVPTSAPARIPAVPRPLPLTAGSRPHPHITTTQSHVRVTPSIAAGTAPRATPRTSLSHSVPRASPQFTALRPAHPTSGARPRASTLPAGSVPWGGPRLVATALSNTATRVQAPGAFTGQHRIPFANLTNIVSGSTNVKVPATGRGREVSKLGRPLQSERDEEATTATKTTPRYSFGFSSNIEQKDSDSVRPGIASRHIPAQRFSFGYQSDTDFLKSSKLQNPSQRLSFGHSEPKDDLTKSLATSKAFIVPTPRVQIGLNHTQGPHHSIDMSFEAKPILKEAKPIYRFELQESECRVLKEIKKYGDSGYCKITHGDWLCDGRYCALFLAGSGRFATVWFMFDSYAKFVVAVKVMCASGDHREHKLHAFLKEELLDNERTYLVYYRDYFIHKSPTGSRHTCLVFNCNGNNALHEIQSRSLYRFIPDTNLKDVLHKVRCVLKGLAALHSKHFLHTDVKPENILQKKIPKEFLQSVNKWCEWHKEPITETENTSDVILADIGLGIVAVPNHPLLPTGKVTRIGYVNNDLYGDDYTTREYRAPEVLVGLDFSAAADVFSVGCVFVEWLTGSYLFNPKLNHNDEKSIDKQHIQDFIEVFGERDVHQLISRKKFPKDGNLLETPKNIRRKLPGNRPLKNVLATSIPTVYLDGVTLLVSQMLKVLPEERSTASQGVEAITSFLERQGKERR